MYLLFPGRHHLFTSFQYNYIFNLINTRLKGVKDVNAIPINTSYNISGIVFAITSANHSGTKRNPIPFYLRAMMAQEFANSKVDTNLYVYGIDDVGVLEDFASYTLKQIKHQSDRRLDLKPENTMVVCSTPVMKMYQELGFRILPAELADVGTQAYKTDLPWELIEQMAASNLSFDHESLHNKIHEGSHRIWKTYHLEDKVKNILSDPIIGDDGDITESRDYNSYVRQMDEIAEIKFQDTRAYIQGGRVGDIGCAVGSWIKQASEDSKLFESDFYGIEVARQLFDICNQRKHNGEFSNPNVFFAQKNAVTSLVFEEESMNTIHTSSLTHEIESYGSRNDLLRFIENRFAELAPNGVWINRDVIGPENGDELVLMKLTKDDGSNEDPFKTFEDQESLKSHLDKLSTFSRFLRFAVDFRKEEEDQIVYSLEKIQEVEYVRIKHKDAADFMLTKDYTDNWVSEMHERFCFWSVTDWKDALQEVGFTIDTATHAYTNPWIADNRFVDKVALFGLSLNRLEHPPTNALIIARKR